MPKTSSELKAQAKMQLKGRWGQIIVATLVIMVVSIAVGLVTGLVPVDESNISLFITVQIVGMLISLLIVSPLSYGLIAYTLKFINYQEIEISEVFSGFNRFKDSVLLNLLIAIFIFLWMLPFAIVLTIVLIVAITSSIMGGGISTGAIILLAIIYIAMIVVITIKSLSYGMSYYILVENPDMRASEALNWSKRITKGHKGRMFYIGLSFIGWGILALIPAGLGYIWLTPYINVTMANLYVDIKELNPEYNIMLPGSSTDTPTEENNYN